MIEHNIDFNSRDLIKIFTTREKVLGEWQVADNIDI